MKNIPDVSSIIKKIKIKTRQKTKVVRLFSHLENDNKKDQVKGQMLILAGVLIEEI